VIIKTEVLALFDLNEKYYCCLPYETSTQPNSILTKFRL